MNTEIEEILVRLLEGCSTATDREKLKNWLRESEENRAELEKTEAVWNAITTLHTGRLFDANAGYQKFKELALNTKPAISRQVILRWTKVAASILILFSVWFITYQTTKTNNKAVSYFELTTPKGSHSQLTLTDGTKIWLNAGSKLRYPNKFDAKERIVYLEGEAFFEVKKDPEHPFIVKTTDINVKALGTAFNVKAYPNEGTVETTLVNGIVVVEQTGKNASEKSVKLTPNQKVTFIKSKGKVLLDANDESLRLENNAPVQTIRKIDNNVIVTSNINTEVYTSWKENRLLFENESFESISNKLERRYGVTIIFKNEEIKRYRFSGKFPEISIDRALKALQFASPFNYEIKHDTIFVNP